MLDLGLPRKAGIAVLRGLRARTRSLPVLILTLSGTARLARIMRANLLDELDKQYVLTARAKGLHPFRVLTKYPLRVAFNPFVADIGNLLPSMVSGSVLVSVVQVSGAAGCTETLRL